MYVRVQMDANRGTRQHQGRRRDSSTAQHETQRKHRCSSTGSADAGGQGSRGRAGQGTYRAGAGRGSVSVAVHQLAVGMPHVLLAGMDTVLERSVQLLST